MLYKILHRDEVFEDFEIMACKNTNKLKHLDGFHLYSCSCMQKIPSLESQNFV